MSAEQDAGSSGKKLGTLIALSLLIVLGGGYLLMSWLGPQSSAGPSAVNLNSTTTGNGGNTQESPRYRELLKADNNQGAEAARREHTTFIASLPMGLDSHDAPPPPEPSPPQSPPDTRQPSTASGDTRATDEKRQARLQQLLTRIRLRQTGQPPVTAKAMWGGKKQPEEAGVMGSRLTANTSTTRNDLPPVTVIPALTRVPAMIETAIDSDNLDSQVLASIQAGPWKGGILYSPGVKLAGNGVQIHFTQMHWRGQPLKVNAWAQRESDLQSSVASDVSHHWITQIVLPSVLSGTGELGKLYRDANTEVVRGNFGDVTSHVGTPDGSAVAGVMLGGAAERGSEVLTKALGNVPFKQVEVWQGEVISVLFVDPVTTTPQTDPLSSAPGVPPATTVRSSDGSASFDAQHRLQNITEKRRAEMRQRYPWQEEQ